jgi:hypothetical protein
MKDSNVIVVLVLCNRFIVEEYMYLKEKAYIVKASKAVELCQRKLDNEDMFKIVLEEQLEEGTPIIDLTPHVETTPIKPMPPSLDKEEDVAEEEGSDTEDLVQEPPKEEKPVTAKKIGSGKKKATKAKTDTTGAIEV